MDRSRNRRRDALHVFVLSSFAFSDPLLERLAARKVYLDHNDFRAVLLVVLTLCVLLPAIVVLAEVALGGWISRKCGKWPREWLHALIVFLAFSVLVLQLYKAVHGLPGIFAIPLALITAGVATRAYFRSSRWRLAVTLASPGIFLFPAAFAWQVWGVKLLGPTDALPPIHVRNPVPVVMLSFDEFCGTSLLNANREIDKDRYPHFAALTKDATWYRNATSVHPRTARAMPAILSGIYSTGKKTPVVSDYPQNLFTTLLAAKNYELLAFEPFSKLFPETQPEDLAIHEGIAEQACSMLRTLSIVYLHHVLPPDLPIQLPQLPRDWHGMRRTAMINWARRTGVIRYSWDTDRDVQFDHFLNCITASERPTLHFGHFAIPHLPWSYLPSGMKYREDNGWNHVSTDVKGAHGDEYETWGSDDLIVSQYYQRYLLQVGYADRQLGRLVEHLKAINLFDRCLFIVVADHGVSFRANFSRRSPTASNLADIMSVPLFIKLPNQRRGTISDRNVQTIDIFPTIAEVLGLDLPFPVDGVSVFDESQPERAEKTFDNEGQIIKIDAAFESRYGTLQDMLAQFGSGADPESLFRLGPHSNLIGRRLDQLDVGSDSDLRIRLQSPASFRQDSSTGVVPCYLDGEVLLEATDPRLPIELAIAIDGAVRAVTRTCALPELKLSWAAMLPEAALAEGDNDVQIFVITKNGDHLRFHQCRTVELPEMK